jgi:hypothetical protein
MRKMLLWATILAVMALLIGCETMDKVMHGADVVAGKASVVQGAAEETEFRDGEVLCASYERESMMDNRYYLAKILTQPSASTKNQAEVLFVNSGEKMWSPFVIPSHKASKSDMELGKIVLYHNWASSEEVSAEAYRKESWYLGRISSTDDLFKDMVEVNGKGKYIKWLRIPEVTVKE